jgi:hypothetical protein
MATLVISRHWNYQSAMVPMNVYINGQRSGSITNNSERSFRIPNGTVSVQLKWDIWGSSDGDPITFVDVKETSKFAIACYPQLVTSKIITFINAEE